MNRFAKKKNAFTLAEVLLTLGTIGIVAALTLPSLIVKYEKQRTVTQLKKAYTEIAQAVKMSEIEYGSAENWDFGTLFDGASATKFLNTYLVPHLNVVKNCGTGTGCLKGNIYSLTGIENGSYGDTKTTTARIKVNSGYTIGATSGGSYINIFVALNNKRNKLIIGKDVFFFIITNKGIVNPHGELNRDDIINHSSMGCKKINSQGAGMHCSGLIVTDSWEIKDDYPW